MELLYFNTNKMPDNVVDMYLQVLPGFMQQEVKRFKFLADQKLRLAGRLMLRQSLQHSGLTHLLNDFRRDCNNKPVIDGWKWFNISHSGDLVVFCSDEDWVGIDIEKRNECDYTGIMKYFHHEEQEYILDSDDVQKAFYEIWVKKEAFLKAAGTGIINGLKNFSCLAQQIEFRGRTGYFHEFNIHPEYAGFICCFNNSQNIEPRRFEPEMKGN